jgi:PAS domain S-box-containing protein
VTGFFLVGHSIIARQQTQGQVNVGLFAKLLPPAMRRWILVALGGGEDKFARVFQTSPDWIVITRLSDSVIVEANLGFQAISGYSPQEVMGKPMKDFNVWALPEQRTTLVEELMRVGYARDRAVVMRRRDGALRDCTVNCMLIALEGETHSHAVWVARDMTESLQAERALVESEARFSRLFELSPVPMCYASDSNGYATTQWNQAWFKSFGFDSATAQGKSGRALNVWVNPADRDRLLGMTSRGEESGDMEVQMRTASGSLRWFWVSTRVFTESQRTLFVSSYFDITERRQAQEQIEELNSQLELRVAHRTAELQNANHELSHTLDTLKVAKDQLVQSEKLAALGALVAGVAHELNTPIGNGLTVASSLEDRVKEFSAMLETGIKRSELQTFVNDTRLAAEILERNLARAGALVADFKQVAVDQTSSHRRNFALSAFVSEVLTTLSPAIRKSGCVIQKDVPSDLSLNSYPGPLGQVLTNLINNAMVHGFAAEHTGAITVRARSVDNDRLEISVQDTGRGIKSQDLNRVFEPFFTTRLGQGGSGLGLHIVHNIVTGVLGGTIDVQSVPEQGSTFTLIVPVMAPEPCES